MQRWFYLNHLLVDKHQPWKGCLSSEYRVECAAGLTVLVVVMNAVLVSSYLVDPASSHMLVSKIKPCMSKYKQICTVKLRMAH
jgi:hypothetical protein